MPVFDMKPRSPSDDEDLTLGKMLTTESTISTPLLVPSRAPRSIDEEPRLVTMSSTTTGSKGSEHGLGSRAYSTEETELVLTDEERDHYYELFRSQPHVHGFLEGNRARILLMESGLSTDILGHIW
jgi:hypothetical protein